MLDKNSSNVTKCGLAKGNKMLKKVCKMLTNVGNWRAEMSENVGRKCQGM
jgi:hypothetical protein